MNTSRMVYLAMALLVIGCEVRSGPPRPRQGYQQPPPPNQPYQPGQAQPGQPPPPGTVTNGGVQQLPPAVAATLERYVAVLRSSQNIDACAANFTPLAGGGLVDESGTRLRSTVPQFSLKKDFNNVRFYAQPLQITRVDVRPNTNDGYGASALHGVHYKIWIGKAPGVAGMPAPISIMFPEGHPQIREPKVIGIGSL
jgi:hypothetical protein